MDNNFWIQALRLEARRHNMCAENRLALAKDEITKEDAIRLYQKTIDWALEEDYPSIEFLRKEFLGFEQMGLFIDKSFKGDLIDFPAVCVFHHCTGTIRVDLNTEKAVIPMLYFANDCNITIYRPEDKWGSSIRVPVYIFGDNSISAKNDDNVEFIIHRFDVIER